MKEQAETTYSGVTTGLKLVLHNDDHNPFQKVILLLIMIMDYDPQRSEQIAYLVHHRGKYAIKEGGDLDELLAIKEALVQRGLTVTLE